ncbi:DUF1127 domain-containing protein [Bradyrhizobium sp. CIAT3101]|uniref:DUF1127 domain-containing protein n=1 Tax=Bradyrhizobium sp. CIAT3101 TaxID=439387 RepID=UPI0024B112F7|nr:DUF1127 domain-containing protein [Bradyrhizobium sp. CIAT3101]WFU78464.1 DUF1127 domain-containing protein [Bradyrhizobium sp. CIAT3101]
MLKQNLPSNVVRVVRPLEMEAGRIADISDRRRSDRRDRAVRPGTLGDAPRPLKPSAEADRPTSWWSAVLLSVMEGFALYGAALHPNATFPVEAMPRTVPPGSPRPDVSARIDLNARRHWSWWSALGETTAVLWKHWRREREISRAVVALSSYDDRTLRDLGINGRADIERVVRYCRDC